MKNIKLFGACAAVALFSACSNEEDLATNEEQVPEGMHKVTLTIDKNVTTDQNGKKRVNFNVDNGQFSWQLHEDIAVLYKNLSNTSQTKFVRFAIDEGYHYWGEANKQVFTALVDNETYRTMAPTDVYSSYIFSERQDEVTVSDYEKVPTEQVNLEDAKSDLVHSVVFGTGSQYINMHLHGTANTDHEENHGFPDKFVGGFSADLYLDNAAFVYIDKEDLPGLNGEYDSRYYTVALTGNVYGQPYSQTYTINCIESKTEGFQEESGGQSWDNVRPSSGLSFFAKVPSGGISDLEVTVFGEVNNKTYTTKGNAKLEAAKRYKLEVPGATKGTAFAKINGKDVKVPWVKLWNSGPKFAKYNVGVTDGKEESYGGYYAWGGIQDMVNDPYTGSGDLTSDNDTATKLWGSNWRLPKSHELAKFDVFCDLEWTTVNGVYGLKITGKGDYEDNCLFLPAAGGSRAQEVGVVAFKNSRVMYWSSTHADNKAAYLQYNSNASTFTVPYTDPSCILSVRAVLVEE